jgi:O-antigen biosynthesis protein
MSDSQLSKNRSYRSNALMEAAQFQPKRLSFPDSWVGHTPFAYYLMRTLQPSVFVELGTHSGNSYLTFCQSVVDHQLESKCYAIDTWGGDAHSGLYGEDVFKALAPHHERYYASFSRLMRMTFDEGLEHFQDGSVDLLHIDGLHDYETVRHDFETWLPKLSDDAVVLFHDTVVREGGFGVWKLWDELTQIYPRHFEFTHSNGLGVLSINCDPKSKLQLPWLELASTERVLVEQYFQGLGAHLTKHYHADRLEEENVCFRAEVQSLTQLHAQCDTRIEELGRELDNWHNSLSWRTTKPLRKAAHRFRQIKLILSHLGQRLRHEPQKLIPYLKHPKRIWPELKLKANRASAVLHELSLGKGSESYLIPPESPDAVLKALDRLAAKPTISILMPTYNTDERWLRAAIDSVIQQTYPHWQLCIVDDASTAFHVEPIIREYAATDERITALVRECNGHISQASNDGLEMAQGTWVALLDHDDELRPDALWEAVKAINNADMADMIYSDEDKIDESGEHHSPFFKPDWSPDYFLTLMYTCHLALFRTENLRTVGGFREGFEGSQDYDLVLRYTEQYPRVHHIPKVLYSWRSTSTSTASNFSAKDYTTKRGLKALEEAVERRGEGGKVCTHPTLPNRYWVTYPIQAEPSVGVVIPTRDQADVLEQCLQGLFEHTDYSNLVVTVVDNGSRDKKTYQLFDRYMGAHPEKFRVLPMDMDFNFSKLNNEAVRTLDTDHILLLNNDIEIPPEQGSWLRELVGFSERASVGAVGPMLLYPDGTIQHAGIILGIGGVAGHSHKYIPSHVSGYGDRLVGPSNYSAITGACLLIKRSIYLEVGGLDEELAVSFNDVDFCIRVRDRNYYQVIVPQYKLIHHESKSRGPEDTRDKKLRFQREIEFMKQKWGSRLLNDPFYNQHLSLRKEDFSHKWLSP